MGRKSGESEGFRIRGSLRLRLSLAAVAGVLVVTGVGTYLDYRREHRVHLDQVLASLSEQARALQMARRQITQPAAFARYVDDVCAQMNDYISPGHHILVLDGVGRAVVRARHHSGAAVERALLAADPEQRVLSVRGHTLAQVRLTDHDGATIILAQYLDRVEAILRGQLLRRGATMGAAGLAVALLVFFFVDLWGIRPISRLAEAAKAWSGRAFSVRIHPGGPAEIRYLADELNAMAAELQRNEDRRTEEMEQAKRIQHDLLPLRLPPTPGLSIATAYRPVAHVAGDLYDVFELSPGRTAVVILDVAGRSAGALHGRRGRGRGARQHAGRARAEGDALGDPRQDAGRASLARHGRGLRSQHGGLSRRHHNCGRGNQLKTDLPMHPPASPGRPSGPTPGPARDNPLEAGRASCHHGRDRTSRRLDP